MAAELETATNVDAKDARLVIIGEKMARARVARVREVELRIIGHVVAEDRAECLGLGEVHFVGGTPAAQLVQLTLGSSLSVVDRIALCKEEEIVGIRRNTNAG